MPPPPSPARRGARLLVKREVARGETQTPDRAESMNVWRGGVAAP